MAAKSTIRTLELGKDVNGGFFSDLVILEKIVAFHSVVFDGNRLFPQ